MRSGDGYRKALRIAVASLVLWTVGCGDDGEVGSDAGLDAGARPDAGVDGGGVVDGGARDGAMPDGAMPDGAMPDGAMPDGAMSDGSMPDGALLDGAVDDGAVDDGAVDDGAVDDAAVDVDKGTDAGVGDSAAETAAVVSAIDEGEIAVARLAQDRAQDASVRAYADLMVEDHGASEARLQRIVVSLGVAPQATELSARVTEDATETSRRLEGLTDEAFDSEYIASQAAMHVQALALIDTQLLRRTQDPQLRALLAELRGELVQHLRMAQQLQRAQSR